MKPYMTNTGRSFLPVSIVVCVVVVFIISVVCIGVVISVVGFAVVIAAIIQYKSK